MPRPLVATAAYPMQQDWVEAYLSGIAALSEPVTLLLLREAGTAMPDVDMPRHRVISPEAPAGVTGPALRAAMLQAAVAEAPEFVICVDFDDVIGADAVAQHRTALQNADISFSDMTLMDGDGVECRRQFHDAMAVPQYVEDSAAITAYNFFGFTNTALKTCFLREWDGVLPAGVVAADWWLFTHWLDGGAKASCTTAPTVAYRSHDSSLLGARKAADLTMLSRRLGIAQAHFAALPSRADRQVAQRRLQALSVGLKSRPAEAEHALATLPSYCVWFQDVFAVADRCGEGA